MDAKAVMEWVSGGFEAVGVLVIVGGFFVALLQAARAKRGERYAIVRGTFGQGVLLGLEILVAADLIRTVTVTTTLDSVIVLGLLVLIRTFLSWSFEIELDGVLPWRRRAAETPAGSSRAVEV